MQAPGDLKFCIFVPGEEEISHRHGVAELPQERHGGGDLYEGSPTYPRNYPYGKYFYRIRIIQMLILAYLLILVDGQMGFLYFFEAFLALTLLLPLYLLYKQASR